MAARTFAETGVTETFTGRAVNAFDLRVEDICIEDIAHHLSMECRFAGACSRRYSVGEHSILVRRFLWVEYGATAEVQLAGLMHDAFEAYAKDIPQPQKGSVYKMAETRGMHVIADALGFDYPNPLATFTDRVMIWLEVDAFLPSRGVGWQDYDSIGADVIAKHQNSIHAKRLRDGPGAESVIEVMFLRDYAALKEEIKARGQARSSIPQESC
ncbi:MAG: hypothetical protein QGD90_00980 [Candidatus Hydrogenedentes bacterium]|nr:hypothetical protein [Candidatus Hydrogenedentota bacterium]